MEKLKGLTPGEEAAQNFHDAVDKDPSLRAEVERHMNSIIDIAKKRKHVFTKEDLSNYLRKRHHSSPPVLGEDTCFSEPPGL
jgi:hypothetical protein